MTKAMTTDDEVELELKVIWEVGVSRVTGLSVIPYLVLGATAGEAESKALAFARRDYGNNSVSSVQVVRRIGTLREY